MLWVQYCVHSSFLYILPPSSQTFLRNRSPGQQQQQQKTTPTTPTTTTTFEKVWRCFLNSIQGLEFKEIFQEHSECFIFCSIYFGCMWISIFLPSFCSLFAFSACFMLHFSFDCFFSYLEKSFELLHHDYFCFTAQAFFTVQMTTINVWLYGFAFTVYRQQNLEFVTSYETGQTTFYISPLSNIYLTPC